MKYTKKVIICNILMMALWTCACLLGCARESAIEENKNKENGVALTKSVLEEQESQLSSLAVNVPDDAYNSVAELKMANVVVGDKVYTKGYAKALDGGAAQYNIVAKSSYGNDGIRGIELNNGLFAELVIENNTVIAEQFGAVGDGVADDAPIFQNIIDCGYNLQLTRGKVYKFISNGIYISNPVSIIGNDATILADDTYAPTASDFQYYLIRNKYGKKIDSFVMNDVNININFSNGRIKGREFVVISPLTISNIGFDNITMNIAESDNCMTCLWVNNGCDSFSISNSKLINNTTGETGGALWLRSKDDKIVNGFSELKNCIVSNTYLHSSSADEVFAVWGKHDTNVEVINSTIHGDIRAPGKTRVVSVFSQGDNNATFNVLFKNCNVIGNCNKKDKNSYYDAVFGIGTDYPSNTINVKYDGGSVLGNVYGALLFPSFFRSEYLDRFDGTNRPVCIAFSNCNIDCDSTITGTATYYYDTSAEYPSCAWDSEFINCRIVCDTAFAYLYVPSNMKFYVPKIKIDGCKIKVDNAKAFIFQEKSGAGADLTINNTDVKGAGLSNIIELDNKKNGTVSTQENSIQKTESYNSHINGRIID